MNQEEKDHLLEKIQELIYDVKMLVGFTIIQFVMLSFLFLMVFGFIIIAF